MAPEPRIKPNKERVVVYSFSAHITEGAREKLKKYGLVNECRNNSDTLEHLIEATKVPEPKVVPAEPDPDQTQLPGCDES